MSFGIKVSKPNTNVFTVGTDDLLVDTTYPLLKVKQSGSGSLTVSDGGEENTDVITHSLGYVPRVLIYGQYYDVGTGLKISNYVRYPMHTQVVGAYNSYFDFTIDDTSLTIRGYLFDETTYSGTFDYFYYIFYDEE